MDSTGASLVSAGATIARTALVPGHDGEAELLVELRHDNGGVVQLTLDSAALSQILANAGISTANELIGKDWSHLVNRTRPTNNAQEHGERDA